MTLSGHSFAIEKQIEYEPPQRIFLSDAINRALHKSFESRIEFESMLQAKKTAEAAYLNTLPNINLGTLAAPHLYNLSTFPFVVIGSVGQFFPFLLPSRWIHAKSAGALADAQKTAFTLMQANLAAEVEGLGYLYERDLNIGSFYKKTLDQILLLKSSFENLQGQTAFSSESFRKFQILSESLQLEKIKTESAVKFHKYTVAKFLGFLNPEAVEEFVIDLEEKPIEEVTPFNSKAASELALRRSFEIRQIDSILKSAKYDKTQLWFSWLDPDAEIKSFLGPNLPSKLEGAQSRIRQLEIRREHLQSLITKTVYETVAGLNEAIESYRLANSLSRVAEQDFRTALEHTLTNPETFNSSFESTLSHYIFNFVRAQIIHANFKINRSKLDRMLLDGFYFELLQKIQS